MARLHVPTRLRWADLDGYGHVNNADMLRLLEEARIEAFWTDGAALGDAEASVTGGDTRPDAVRLGDIRLAGASTAVLDASPGADTLSLIARQEVEYLLPIPYMRQPLDIQLWIAQIGGASFEICYEVRSPLGQEPALLYTKAATTLVLVDRETMRPRRIRDYERAAWEPYLDEPIRFSKRR
ncbi:acyl-CoA thioesterase [Lacisediminihabitans changchengi]|uniref:Acyl-CoA thioesterase n=1 Tax=Lacisediminihabitans changchengi TaxID=2787634 RepID=A0A934SI65_9MICO|nr:thioesterase family protein [Lacisediminihabitans changchengi]MBK4346048.1 acyl-CoA thioesterase [Lacisediminihabitans changchengi]